MTWQSTKTGSSLSQSEQDLHITSLIFLTSKLGLKPFVNEQIVHVKLLSDNTTTAHSKNRMGSIKSTSCNETFCEIWKWVDEHNI